MDIHVSNAVMIVMLKCMKRCILITMFSYFDND